MTDTLQPYWQPKTWQWLLAAFILLLLGLSGWQLANEHSQLAISLWTGAAFGYVLQRSRFCFYCVSRDFIERRHAGGLLGILVALLLGGLAYQLVLGAFVPDAQTGRLPPNAHIGPVGLALALGAFSFGIGMALAGSCISALLYRLGEGAFSCLYALAGVLVGFVLGFYSWNPLYLGLIQGQPEVWLPSLAGYSSWLIGHCVILLILAGLLIRWHKAPSLPNRQPSIPESFFALRWPGYVGGILVAAIAGFAYLRVAPLGVTAELGSISRTLGQSLPAFPTRLEGLDTLRGCATAVKESIWSNNGVFILALIAGSLVSALPAGDFRPSFGPWRQIPRLFFGGLLMGFGAFIALGCTVGVILSGIMTGALSGWIFLVCCAAGLLLGWWLRKRLS